ncbi:MULTISPECIES: type VII secretion integral membrane protein EccD [Thermomonospora]|uniref:Secretion protein snm4 n=1 Tax=Thermomonospora curvata (strain ATCC 19995 / DSM 43183 / JCM 3096 / KCTC 9072 / NBRC 15933 / NCIMB 10081 / Henssen B9) TaxID=471852 RepID=D1A4G8_THECD|nr:MULTISPECIES: type VII secretion integral membrane protein EccD [Thermomonospora]ACY96203.1 secretion protein snm4 [Thermomonospora curvata DSM 43183]PKK15633.1 MAG: type VII secretion integral membrane protein EccD [Thermomonospora sp. CIF 1]
MSPTTGTDLCRVTVVGPQRRVDISLPTDVPFAQLFPAILHYLGENLAEQGLAHGGWVLQRLDEAPFSGDMTPGQAGLRDGEQLYLRPGMSQLPEPSFDDVADVVATGVNEQPDRWRIEWTRVFGLGVGAGAAAVAAVILLLAGPPDASWIVPSVAAAVIALLLLAAGAAVSRAVGDSVAGAVLGFSALPHAFLGGLLGPARSTPLTELEAFHLLSGFAAVVLVSAVAAVAVADGLPLFVGTGAAGLAGTLGAGAGMLLEGVSAAGIAAVTTVVFMTLIPLAPTLAFRLARVTLPPPPANVEELRRDTLPVDGRTVRQRTVRADRIITGITLAVGAVGLVAVVPLAFDDGWLGPITGGCIALALLLRSRLFRGRYQRLNLMVSGMAAFGVLAIAIAADASQPVVLLGAVAPLLVGAGIVVGTGLWLPGRKLSPFWGRAADVCDFTVVLALIPLSLGEAGLYGWVRGLGG